MSKKYFEKKYSIKIKDKSTAQIIKLFKENNLVTEETIEKIKEVLTKADLIKFGAENKDEKIINKLIEDIKEIVK